MCLVTCKNKKYNEYRDQRAEFTPYSEMRRVSAAGAHAAGVHAAVTQEASAHAAVTHAAITHAAVIHAAAVRCGS